LNSAQRGTGPSFQTSHRSSNGGAAPARRKCCVRQCKPHATGLCCRATDSAHWHIHCSTARCRFRIATCPPSTRNLLTAPSSPGVHCVARPASRCTCGHSLACEAHSRRLECAGAACACGRTRWGALKSAQSSKSKDFCSSRDEQNGQPSTTSGPGADVAGVSPVPVQMWQA